MGPGGGDDQKSDLEILGKSQIIVPLKMFCPKKFCQPFHWNVKNIMIGPFQGNLLRKLREKKINPKWLNILKVLCIYSLLGNCILIIMIYCYKKNYIIPFPDNINLTLSSFSGCPCQQTPTTHHHFGLSLSTHRTKTFSKIRSGNYIVN